MPETVGLIGLGLVGKALVRRLTAAGYPVVGCDANAAMMDEAASLGVTVRPDARAVAGSCGTLLLSLPDSDVVGHVLWEQGVAQALAPGTMVLDTTTGRPSDAVDNHARLATLGVDFADVTLSGSSAEIAVGTATALVGAERTEAIDQLVRCFAASVFYLTTPGAGCLAKLIVNHVMGLNRVALAEGLALGQRAGLDGTQLLDILRDSAAYSRVLDIKGERMVSGDFTPASRIAQHAKDVGLILQLAQQLGAITPLEQLHCQLLQQAIEAGWGELDNAAIVKAFEETGDRKQETGDRC